MSRQFDYDSILIRYGELGLKDSNRGLFEKKLQSNIQDQLKAEAIRSVERFQAGLRVNLVANSDVPGITQLLRTIPGIAWFAASWESERSPEAIGRKILEKEHDRIKSSDTFSISTQRSAKDLELNSQEYNVEVGRIIDDETSLSVDLDSPDWSISIHLLKDRAQIFFKRHEGFGGLPVGSSGEAICLLSGGIDSPVAAIKAYNRGSRLDFLHFYPYPDVDTALDKKIKPILNQLIKFGNNGILYMAPYHVFDLNLPSIPERDEIIFFRRHMIRIASRIAEDLTPGGIITGGSLGQVSSQTLSNMGTISQVTDYPVLRPLVGIDKDQIIKLAKKYNTFSISNSDYRDCCSISARSVRTTSKNNRFETLEEKHDFEQIDRAVLEATQVYEFDTNGVRPLEENRSQRNLLPQL